jgi:hypothetical protein
MIKQMVRIVTTVTKRIKDRGNNGSFEVDDFINSSLSTHQIGDRKCCEMTIPTYLSGFKSRPFEWEQPN